MSRKILFSLIVGMIVMFVLVSYVKADETNRKIGINTVFFSVPYGVRFDYIEHIGGGGMRSVYGL